MRGLASSPPPPATWIPNRAPRSARAPHCTSRPSWTSRAPPREEHMAPTQITDVFRFVALRPPDTADEDDPVTAPLRDRRKPEGTAVGRTVAELGQRPSRGKLNELLRRGHARRNRSRAADRRPRFGARGGGAGDARRHARSGRGIRHRRDGHAVARHRPQGLPRRPAERHRARPALGSVSASRRPSSAR